MQSKYISYVGISHIKGEIAMCCIRYTDPKMQQMFGVKWLRGASSCQDARNHELDKEIAGLNDSVTESNNLVELIDVDKLNGFLTEVKTYVL